MCLAGVLHIYYRCMNYMCNRPKMTTHVLHMYPTSGTCSRVHLPVNSGQRLAASQSIHKQTGVQVMDEIASLMLLWPGKYVLYWSDSALPYPAKQVYMVDTCDLT